MVVLLMVVGCFLTSVVLMILLRFVACRRGRLYVKKVALVGGIGIALSVAPFSIAGAMFIKGDLAQVFWVMLVSVFMLVFGVWDDLKEHSVKQKFLFQFLCATALIVCGIKTHIVYVGFGGNILISYVWILGVTNAFNLLDITDGLSAGVAFLSAAAILIASMIHPHAGVFIMALMLCSAIVGFWIFNCPPASVYLGNAGSHFLGFLLSALTLLISYSPDDRPMALLSPIVMLWLPLLETALLIYFRLRRGIWPFHKSRDHMAFQLMSGGFSQQKTLGVMLGLALFFSLAGVLISLLSVTISCVVLVVVVAASGFLFVFLQRMALNVE